MYKFNKHTITTLAMFVVMTVTGTNTPAQQKSWNTLEDIRQVTDLGSATPWETIKHDKGVTLSSRWLTFGDSMKTREISSQFVVYAGIQNVLANLMQPERLIAWNYGVRSMKILGREGSTWITHAVYDIPYPLSQQDLVVKNVLIMEKQNAIILMSALPDYIEPLGNVTRQNLYFGKWELTSLNDGSTEVRFSAISFSKSAIPRFVRDPIIQNKMFNSFLKLRELSS